MGRDRLRRVVRAALARSRCLGDAPAVPRQPPAPRGSGRTAVAIPVGVAPLQIPGIDIFGAFRSAIEWSLEQVLRAVLGSLDAVFSVGLEWFLFFRNPTYVAALNGTWWTTLGLYLAIVLVATFGQLLTAELRPQSEGAGVQRWLRRVLLGFVAVLVSRELIGFAVALTNAIAGEFYRYPFRMRLGAELVARLFDSGSLFVSLALTPVVVVLLLFGLGLLFVLAVRMYLVYVVYAVFPLLMALWVVDVGPAEHAKALAEQLFSVTAHLLLAGIVLTAVLSIGVVIADLDGGTPGDASGADLSFDDGSGPATVDGDRFRSALSDLVTFLGTIGTALAVSVLAVVRGAT
ncbi:hypothetical protein I7X12_05635 [Halosimplex litoreum]|uniref:Uncharacterized protein n=1 Tax=Halosimplex litoreum TaxID=1198301 RepID=A0A7T3KW97_9EURY|nr:hypothetical protein [Halosimplex litoreum]QPV64107.1 hypothetical protein I7X12_05635 [Halosimplex litoreum]